MTLEIVPIFAFDGSREICVAEDLRFPKTLQKIRKTLRHDDHMSWDLQSIDGSVRVHVQIARRERDVFPPHQLNDADPENGRM